MLCLLKRYARSWKIETLDCAISFTLPSFLFLLLFLATLRFFPTPLEVKRVRIISIFSFFYFPLGIGYHLNSHSFHLWWCRKKADPTFSTGKKLGGDIDIFSLILKFSFYTQASFSFPVVSVKLSKTKWGKGHTETRDSCHRWSCAWTIGKRICSLPKMYWLNV